MKIYFGHSRMTYGTEMEKKAIEIIKKYYPGCEIVNPNIPEHQEGCLKYLGGDFTPGEEMKYFLDLTEPCDVGCFLQYYRGRWSAGSAAECNHMGMGRKPVFEIDLSKESLIEIEKVVHALSFEETREKLHDAGLTHFM